jgi:2',3'-cyclic-nucleotide 2'-phosphodiesterase (5'-nucleotidase family)
VKGLADELKASGDYSLVLTASAGDVYAGGEAVAASYNGEFIPAIMDQVYDVVAPGNNDYGLGGAAKQDLLLTSLYNHTITLCANYTANSLGIDMPAYAAAYGNAWIGNELFADLYSKITLNEDGSVNWSGLDLQAYSEGENPYQSTTTFTTSNGTVVGLFGLSTSGGAASTQLDSIGSINAAQTSTDALRAAGATVVVGVGHTGWPDGDDTLTAVSTNDTNSAQLALQTTGIDAFVDGHTHSIINDGEGWIGGESNTYVNQAASFGTRIGVMYLYVSNGTVVAKEGEVIDDVSSITPDADVQALVDTAMAKVDSDLGQTLAHTDYFLNGERQSAANEGGTVRGNETNLGDLMTDVIYNAISEEGYDVDFVMYPGYWLRASIEAGDITTENIQSVFANPTVLEYVTYSAQDVVNEMTKSISVIPGEGTSFLHVSGIKVTYTMSGEKASLDTVTVGDTLIYKDGAIQVGDDWTCSGVYTLTGGEIDNWTGSTDNWICTDKTEVQELVTNYFLTHTEGVDYTIYPNTVAPNGRIVCVG